MAGVCPMNAVGLNITARKNRRPAFATTTAQAPANTAHPAASRTRFTPVLALQHADRRCGRPARLTGDNGTGPRSRSAGQRRADPAEPQQSRHRRTYSVNGQPARNGLADAGGADRQEAGGTPHPGRSPVAGHACGSPGAGASH